MQSMVASLREQLQEYHDIGPYHWRKNKLKLELCILVDYSY